MYKRQAEDSYSIDIPIGNYFNYSVYPTCGLSTTDNLIGEVDDPVSYTHLTENRSGTSHFTGL